VAGLAFLRRIAGPLRNQVLDALARRVSARMLQAGDSGHPDSVLASLLIHGSTEPLEALPEVAHFLGNRASEAIGADGESIAGYARRDHYPIPLTQDREEYHGDRHLEWWLSGLDDYRKMTTALAAESSPLQPRDAVLELGCASGRVLRHLLCQGPDLEVWGADINGRYVEWMRRYLGPRTRILHNTILPHLPMPDASVRLVCAFSVFTHIGDLELGWLAELRRILKPGGHAWLTVLAEHAWGQMKNGSPLYDSLLSAKDAICTVPITPELFARPMPPKMEFSWERKKRVYNSLVFHSHAYLRETWSRFFEVRQIIPAAHGDQDAVLLRRT
jgi:SAM-dependent methyltransferase